MKKIIGMLMIVILLATGCILTTGRAFRGNPVASLSQGKTWNKFSFEGTEEIEVGSFIYSGTTYKESAIITFDGKSINLLPGFLGGKKIGNFFFVWDLKSQKVQIFQKNEK